jgi:endonuclease YncB( thermonuclease family)
MKDSRLIHLHSDSELNRPFNNTLSIIVTLSCLLFIVPIASAQYGHYVVTQVISIYDGDTIRVNIKHLPPIIGQNIRVRLSNIDTPEIKGQCSRENKLALIARDRLRHLVNNAHTIEIHNLQRGKYFRIVADLILDGQNASEMLIREKLGVPYNGGKKIHSWC